MSYNSKKTVCSMGAGLALAATYIIYALGEKAPGPEDIKAWAAAILIFIGISVTAVIAVQILFHILLAVSISAKERDEKEAARVLNSTTVEDERDKSVSQKSSAAGYGVSGTGFIAALIALAVGASFVAALHVTAGAFFLASLVEGGYSVFLYERGTYLG